MELIETKTTLTKEQMISALLSRIPTLERTKLMEFTYICLSREYKKLSEDEILKIFQVWQKEIKLMRTR